MNIRNLFKLLPLCFIIGLAACDNEVNKGFDPDEYEPVVAPDPVRTLNTMASGERIILSSSATESIVFSWSPTEEHGNTVYRYEVLMDTIGGDFSKPIYTGQADGNGLETKLTISHYQLNTIGRQAKFRCNNNGTLRWKVRAYCGLDQSISSLEGYFVIFMMDGLDNIPGTSPLVYITGSATEDNGVAENAQPMLCETDNLYQSFTSLKANEPFDITAVVDGVTCYYYVDETGRLCERLQTETQHTNSVSESGIYRVTVNFESRVVTYDRVRKVYLFCNAGDVRDEMSYLGYGKWGLQNYTARKHKESWAGNGESRHQFRMEITADDQSEQTIIWGHQNKNASDPKADTEEEYYNLYISPSTDPWDYAFRYNGDLLKWGSETDGWWYASVKTDVTLYMNADFGVYTHRWTESAN